MYIIMTIYDFPKINSSKLLDDVTLIFITSPIPSHPDASLMETCIESMKSTKYNFYETVISYDCPKGPNKDYNKYKNYVKKKYPKFTHLERKTHGHFIGTLNNALRYCKTKYFLLVQHDVKLVGGEFPIKKILKCKFDWNIIFTHHKKNGLTEPTHWFPIIKKTRKPVPSFLLKTFGWSERIFIADTKFLRDKIDEIEHEKKSSKFVESVFHKEFDRKFKKLENIKTYKDLPKKSKNQKEYDGYWKEWQCYAVKSKFCYHTHLFGRTHK